MSLKKYAIITLMIMGIIIFHGTVILICIRASGYAHADVFWLGPIGSFVITLYYALLIGFLVCSAILGLIAILSYRQKRRQSQKNRSFLHPSK